ncbi:hypothetical protein L7F22_013255 [Adiantum nelumboides]|nr:hypothetical protein [Adiantum nelumboides]
MAPSSPHPHFEQSVPDDEKIKPMISAFNEKINLSPLVISDSGNFQSKSNDPSMEKKDGKKNSADGIKAEELWPKITELNDIRPPASPKSQNIAIKQVISESASLAPYEHGANVVDDNRPPSPVDESKPTTQVISNPPYQPPKQAQPEQGISWPSIPDHALQKPMPKQHVIREGAYQQSSKAMPDELSLRSGSPTRPSVQTLRDPSILTSPTHDQAAIREDYMNNAQGRLSSVLEESESFARREFGDNMPSYMSTFSSASHASNLSSLRANDSAFDYKHYSYRHNNYHNFTYNLSTSCDHQQGNGNFIVSSKSAPAGMATRTGSAFGLFRRGTSERSGLNMGRRTVYRPHRPRKPKTLANTLLWPLVKIKNGYVGCMMGIEGAGDLTGMAQGGSYATTARYFADVPLSKSDSRNYG